MRICDPRYKPGFRLRYRRYCSMAISRKRLRTLIKSDLMFDVGMHKGEDSEFYLKKGFRVIAVEAVQSLCTAVSERLADSVAAGRLVIVNKAIAETPGARAFLCERSA